MTKYNLAGRTVAITGSTGGLGAALAVTLRARGANLALFDLSQEAVDKQAAELGPATVARGWSADVRDLAGLESVMDAAAEHFGRIDVVIANAGVAAASAPLSVLDPNDFERAIDVNLSGVWRTFRAGLPHVEKRKGYLLAISSMAAFIHSPLNGPYVASKAGVWALADATRLELRDAGVGVGSAHPTFFRTPMMDEVHADPAGTAVWGGNTGGMWKMIPIEEVVDAIVDGIENRADLIVAPKNLAMVARMPGVVRPFVERFGFPGSTIRDAMALATRKN
ncbi:SDR family NAD(P)-dependent oxidoreductase [Skermania sp. ID1734]|uniref:SDR family NAD(P)-dependent oxidoreductase n=1 Tax=Skermania sp. ID1734 TaxID=2597516 RepID=UPI00117F7552|nr:SDR family NAD(P)-dependent oxidoreductase [Skermania sp. ID1734]TSE00085.1 SDR family NAD(P)-dependent oxidoreductase [Skermania sp. ID1734]